MFGRSRQADRFTGHGHARRLRRQPVVHELEPRCLLSVADLTTAAQVTAMTGANSVIEPMSPTYALNSSSVQVDFMATDPDHPGSTPVTHFQVTNLTNQTTMSGTGNSVLISAPGIYSVQYWSTDSDDSELAGSHSILIGLDRSAPVVSISTVTPNTLWPPNGKFVTVTVTGVATDTLTGVNPSSLSFHVQDEYGLVQPSGPITSIVAEDPTAFGGDGLVRFAFQVQLQARRHGYDFDGRQYTISVDAFDGAGNLGTAATIVTVPHDMGRHSGGIVAGGGGAASGGQLGGSRGTHHHGGKLKVVGGSSNSHGHKQSGSRSTVPIIPTAPTLPVQEPGNGRGHGNGNHNHGNGNGNGNGNGHRQGNSTSTVPVVPTAPTLPAQGPGNGQGHGNGNHGNRNGNANGNGNGNGNGHGNGNGNGHGH
jgi:hypothetical protein